MNPDTLARLERACEALRDVAGPHDESLHWLEQCLSGFLAQQGRITLDQAFGLAERRLSKGEQIALEVRRMTLRKKRVSTDEKLERLRTLGLDDDRSNMFKAVRAHAAGVEAQAWSEYLAERLAGTDEKPDK